MKTKTKLLWLALLLGGCPLSLTPQAAAQASASRPSAQGPSMAACFEAMPDIFLPSTKNMRLDMLDFFRSGLKSTVKGPFDNLMEIEELSDSYMRVSVSGAGSWQFKRLPTAEDTVFLIAVVQTVSRPASGSTLSLYTTRWQKKRPARRPARLLGGRSLAAGRPGQSCRSFLCHGVAPIGRDQPGSNLFHPLFRLFLPLRRQQPGGEIFGFGLSRCRDIQKGRSLCRDPFAF